MAKLIVQESAGNREFELVDNEVHIGRELDNALRLADPSISRHHAVVRRTQSGFEIQDLQSSNGVMVNGTKVQTSILQDGDRVMVGQIHMTFVDPQAANATIAMPSAAAPTHNPLGTMRMDASEMAKIQGLQAPFGSSSTKSAPAAPPLPPEEPAVPLSAPPPPQADAFVAAAGPEASGENPAPAILQSWLPPVPDDAQPLFTSNGQLLRGEFVPRLLAAVIDYLPMLLLSLLSFAVAFITARTGLAVHSGAELAAGIGATMGIGCLFTFIQVVLGLGYLFFIPWCWMKFGATPGKKMMKLRVVPEANPMGRIDINAAVLRMVGYLANGVISWILSLMLNGILSLALGPMGLFGGAMLLFPIVHLVCSLVPYALILMPDRKGLQDIFAKTLVIRVDR